MGVIENVVKLFTKQKCVYWGNPVSDGNSGYTFAAPVEIDCRWDDKQELKTGYYGNKFASQAQVLVNIDLSRRGYLYNGTLVQLRAEATANGYDINNPREFPTAFIIEQFEKIPMVFSSTDFVRTAFLFDQG
jgi:hypothetical protein